MTLSDTNRHALTFILLNAACLFAFELRLLGLLSEFQWKLVVYLGFMINGGLAGYALLSFRRLRWLAYLGISFVAVLLVIAPTPVAALWMVSRSPWSNL
jgi:hypothetical protein